MPFDASFPRSFAASSIREYAPALSGVYGISNAGEWIYIGESDNIQAALLRHAEEWRAMPLERQATGFVYELCDRALRPGRQSRLVSEYGPNGNAQGAQRQARPAWR